MGWVNRLNPRVGLGPGSKFSLWYGLDLVEEIGPTDNSGLVLAPYEQEAQLQQRYHAKPTAKVYNLT